MKKNILILTLCIVLIVITAACSSQNENNSASSENAGIESSVSEEISEELKEFSFESKELGFQTMLPAIASDKIETEITTREHGEETITTLVIYYVGEDDRYNVLSFDSMTERVEHYAGGRRSRGNLLGRFTRRQCDCHEHHAV